jgi:hypothetical protein
VEEERHKNLLPPPPPQKKTRGQPMEIYVLEGE